MTGEYIYRIKTLLRLNLSDDIFTSEQQIEHLIKVVDTIEKYYNGVGLFDTYYVSSNGKATDQTIAITRKHFLIRELLYYNSRTPSHRFLLNRYQVARYIMVNIRYKDQYTDFNNALETVLDDFVQENLIQKIFSE